MEQLEKDHSYFEPTEQPSASDGGQISGVSPRRLRDRELLKKRKAEAQAKDAFQEEKKSKRQRKEKTDKPRRGRAQAKETKKQPGVETAAQLEAGEQPVLGTASQGEHEEEPASQPEDEEAAGGPVVIPDYGASTETQPEKLESFLAEPSTAPTEKVEATKPLGAEMLDVLNLPEGTMQTEQENLPSFY
ncbi:uncharacterized protein LOC102357100 [Latimeria chalumnae]|uniref:uncharacterized protein LOC102357100 n=1 Tax=Latimeria chalumnae TaxID=7897 RepID=UPI0003C16A0F|nr:PREDICTED: hemogen isoform X2 [Latimeria chalumnae]|eukprot:XP_005998482.1 PREDICTED: hemogen isoform X2 [Latimeria chalumnae]